LDSLSNHDLQVLQFGALLGDRIDPDELIQAVGNDQRSATIASLVELSRSNLLVAGSYGDAVEFEHDLVRQAIIGLVEPDHRQTMHASIATSLGGLPLGAGNSASRIAHHWSSAGIHARPEMHRWAIRAGEAALESFAYEEAIRQFLSARKSASNADERVGPLSGLAHAYQQTGHEADALECIREAFDHHMRLGLNQLAIGIAQMEFVGQSGQIGMVPIYQDALELAPAGSVSAARIMSCLSRPLGVHLNQYSAARELSMKAVDIAKKADDTQLELRILNHAIHIENFGGHSEIAKVHCERVIELGRGLEDPLALSNAHVHLSIYALRVGEIKLAKYHSRRAIEHSLNTHNSERISSGYKN
jgi:tetratricopeptide (TPR) repeat protein